MLPPLPEPKRYFGHSTSLPMFDKDEMTAYATAAVDQATEIIESTANFLRGLRLAPGVPEPCKAAIDTRIQKLEEALEKIEAEGLPQRGFAIGSNGAMTMFDADEFLTDWAGIKLDMEHRAMANDIETELEHRDTSEIAHVIAALWWLLGKTKLVP